MVRCWQLSKSRDDQQQSDSKPIGCVMPVKADEISRSQEKKEAPRKTVDAQVGSIFAPFVTEGKVSLKSSARPITIKMARDTCCATSMILEDVLPY